MHDLYRGFVNAQTTVRSFRPAGLTAIVFCVRIVASAVAPLVPAHASDPSPPTLLSTSGESAFVDENEAAMTRMMNAMMVTPSGDIDCDFVAMMVPHHQGAVDMAVIQLRYGKSEKLRRIAQEIIVTQMQEIAAMRLAIGELAAGTAPTQPRPPVAAPDHHQSEMQIRR